MQRPLIAWRARKERADAQRVAEVAVSDRKEEQTRSLLIKAWLDQAMEWTKALFSISSAALGLIAAVLSRSSHDRQLALVFLAVAALAFAVCACASLSALQHGKDLVKAMLADDKTQIHNAETELARLAEVQLHAFLLGICTLLAGGFFSIGD